MPQTHNLIILGASARAAAESAMRGGMRPWCADLFADRDLAAICPVMRCPWACYPSGLLELLDGAALAPDAPVLLTGAIENHTPLVDAIAEQRELIGCRGAAMRSVRDPAAFTAIEPYDGLRPCYVWRSQTLRETADDDAGTAPPAAGRALVKPLRGTGGRGVRAWLRGERIDDDHYLQELVEGRPISAVFHADGAAAVLVGVTEQIVGDPDFAAAGYRYCGSVGPLALGPRVEHALKHLGEQLAAGHELRGLFGVDAILDAVGDIRPVEVNPRYTASVEILERATGRSALTLRRDDSRRSGIDAIRPGSAVHAKAIAFARRVSRVGDLYDLIDRESIADVPPVGQVIETGFPICTLLARGPDHDTCMRSLRAMAARLYSWLDARAGG